MAEQFLTLMADLDQAAQERLSGWYRDLRNAGFTGVQTPDIPYHISLSAFSLSKASSIFRQQDEAPWISDAIISFIIHTISPVDKCIIPSPSS